jgi:hypothetical protein
VRVFHRQKMVYGFQCPRCKRNMGRHEDLIEHLSISYDDICEFKEHPVSDDPEDGFNAKIGRVKTKVATWEQLWKFLFPRDDTNEIPDAGTISLSHGG